MMDIDAYHITRRSLLPAILRQGLLPMCGPDAFASGQEQRRVNIYTSREATRDAMCPDGDYMRTHPGVAKAELCVLHLMLSDFEKVCIGYTDDTACSLHHLIRPKEFVVLDTGMYPISSEELAALAAGEERR